MDQRRNLTGKKWWYGISDLDVLLRPIAQKEVIVGESLQPSSFAYRQAAALDRVRMNEIVAIF